MKKTRIIIPALAMIAFSVAASITGTVAWFTANRTATITSGTYAVVKTTSNLTKTLSSGIGTTAGTDAVTVNDELTDASFDHINKIVYAPDGTGANVGSKTALASANTTNMKRGETQDSKNIYNIATWGVTFSIDFGGAVTNNIGLFLDLSKSYFTPTGNAGDASNQDTSKGFRMAFVSNSTNGVSRVFADLQASSACKYVSAVDENDPLPAGTGYSGDLIDSSSNDGLNTSYTSTAAASMPNYFGYFAYQANTVVSLDFTVVCWYEGTDPNIVNSTPGHTTLFRDVSVNLGFEAITFSA